MSDVEMACSSAYSGRFPAPSPIKCETTTPPQARNPPATHNSILADGFRYSALSPTPAHMESWLVARNGELKGLLTAQGKQLQQQGVMCGELWHANQRVAHAHEQVETHRQILLSENLVLNGNLSQAQYTVAVERFHSSEARRIQYGKDELIAALRQELSLHREHTKTTKEQQRQITCALLTVVHTPDSDRAHSLVKEAYEEQLRENENFREEIRTLSNRADRKNHVQVPMLYSGVPQASSSTHAAGPLGSTNQGLLPQQQQPRVDTEEAVVPSTTKGPRRARQELSAVSWWSSQI
ncbi:hypothetical protein LTR86_010974 [Recurvomyces mirabilis]|nr:hypothetical protein LTR86_010974 [Recurvomyces mirabilis]